MCGPSAGEKQAAATQNAVNQQQAQAYQTMSNQASQIFGNSSQIFNDLTSAFQPILAAGPGQQGYTPAEIANLNSQAITTTGQQYRNAAQAAGERSAASGGGNSLLPSGTTAGTQAQIAAAGAGQTAGELANIQQQSAQVGRQNWLSAAGVLGGAPGVFGAATNAGQAATGSGSAAISGANSVFQNQEQLQKQSNWWQPLVGGVLGGVASGLTGGLSSAIGGAFGAGKRQSPIVTDADLPSYASITPGYPG
jgi:hypothetical protein